MHVKLDAKVPEFTTESNKGKFNLTDYLGKYLVIYFYPKDNTPGCTIEANEFNKMLPEFKELKTMVIGVSGGDEKRT